MPTPETHALLSASSSHRWLQCPPSVRLSEQFPSRTSSDAEAGRVAHAIAELKARKHFPESMSTRTFNSRLKKLKEDPHYSKDMDASTDLYLEHLKELAMGFGDAAPFVGLETRVDFSDYAPEGFGTADCIMIGPGRICVVDYKNGAGVPVEAERNSQMMLYALGALKIYSPIFGDTIHEVHFSIVQPNAGGIKSWNCTRDFLEQWGASIKHTAELAFSGNGEFSAGSWCKFCPANAKCSARTRKMLEVEPMKGALPAESPKAASSENTLLLTDAQIGDLITRGRELVAWLKDLEDYALTAALNGHDIVGYKVVEGRGSRVWNDQDSAFSALRSRGIAEAMLWERKPVTVAGLETILGKKTFADTAADLVLKKPGKPALVPANDKRPVYNPASVAFEVVNANA